MIFFGGGGIDQSYLPSALTGEIGVLKNRTEETITTTRFTQLATECVTGDTLDKIKYESCHCKGRPCIKHKLFFLETEKEVKIPWG